MYKIMRLQKLTFQNIKRSIESQVFLLYIYIYIYIYILSLADNNNNNNINCY